MIEIGCDLIGAGGISGVLFNLGPLSLMWSPRISARRYAHRTMMILLVPVCTACLPETALFGQYTPKTKIYSVLRRFGSAVIAYERLLYSETRKILSEGLPTIH